MLTRLLACLALLTGLAAVGAPAKAATAPECKPRKPVVIYIPTVQFGPDRAFE